MVLGRGSSPRCLSVVAALAAGLAAASLSETKVAAAEATEPSSTLGTTPPRVLDEHAIPYPEGAHGDAVVHLVVIVAADGSVRSVEAESGAEPFLAAALAGVLAWRFYPAEREGRAVAAKIRLEVTFHEPEPPPEREPEPALLTAARAGRATSAPAEAEPPEVVVLGDRPEPGRTATLTRAEVRELPGAFGDPFRALEALPGVTPIVSGLPFFFVRGAPPGNVGYFLDGIRLPLLFHVGVGPAVVHPGLIDHVDLYPGGYPARFGRFAGGILAGETAPPQSELRGEYNLRLFDAGALVETSFASGRGSLLAAGRYSYTALLLSLLSPDVALDYWDYQVRLGYEVTPRARLSAFIFGSYDYLGQKTATETLTLFGTEFHRADVRYDRQLAGGGTWRSALTLGFDRSRADDDRSVLDQLAGVRNELVLPLSPRAKLRAGADVTFDRYTVDLGLDALSPSAASVAAQFPSRTDFVVGLRADVPWLLTPNLEVTPGVRVDLFGSDGATAVGIDPRLATRLSLSPRWSLKSAVGIAHQPPAFVIPLPGFQPGGLRGGLQYALQESFGVEAELGAGTTASATLFQNAFFNMSDPLGVTTPQANGCLPGTFPGDTLAGDPGAPFANAPRCGQRFSPGTLGPDSSGGGGQGAETRNGQRTSAAFNARTLGAAYGLELYLRRKLTDRLGGFLSYTLSRSTRSYQNRKYIASFDRTHVANVALAFDLGRHFRAGTRVVFYTGLPQAPNPEGSTRLPAFFRLDLRLEKRWQLSRSAWLSVVAEWMNTTLRKEAVSTRCTLSGCEAQTVGPISIPSLGLEGGF
jgi:hypothetical protein